jgi:hypothetical protein
MREWVATTRHRNKSSTTSRTAATLAKGKDGHLTVGMAHTAIIKGGPPANSVVSLIKECTTAE